MTYKAKEYTVDQAIYAYDTGSLSPEDMFWDWFCSDKALNGRGKKLFAKLKSIYPSPKYNCNQTYVFFKNNCPLAGKLYDDFRICDIKTGKTLYTVTPSVGHRSMNGEAEVWGKDNDFKEPLVSGTWDDVKNFFLKND